MRDLTFKIEGMRCDGCANLIQSSLKRQAGVNAVEVSFAEGLAHVLFNPKTISEHAIVAATEKAGYQVPGARSC